jgi:transposase
MRVISREPYPSDLSDEHWEFIEDPIPKQKPHPNFPKDEYSRREIVNAILYLMRTGCQWRHLPHDLPAWTLVAHDYYAWRHGVIDAVGDGLRDMARDFTAGWPHASCGSLSNQRPAQLTEDASRTCVRGSVWSRFPSPQPSPGGRGSQSVRRVSGPLFRIVVSRLPVHGFRPVAMCSFTDWGGCLSVLRVRERAAEGRASSTMQSPRRNEAGQVLGTHASRPSRVGTVPGG